jgi:hypothetical protein
VKSTPMHLQYEVSNSSLKLLGFLPYSAPPTIRDGGLVPGEFFGWKYVSVCSCHHLPRPC